MLSNSCLRSSSSRVTSRDSLRPVDAAAHLLRAIYRRHPRQFRWRYNGIEELSGSRALRGAVERGLQKFFAAFESRVASSR